MENKNKLKIFQKPAKGHMPVLWIVTGWVVFWNIIYQIMHANGLIRFGRFEVVSWAFFLTITVFFLQSELSNIERFFTTLCGGAVGILLAAGVMAGIPVLMGWGMSALVALSILLAITIGMLILLPPYMPYFFNNVGFCYYIIYFVYINVEDTAEIAVVPSCIGALVLGSIVMNLGCMLVLELYAKHMKKKAAK